MLSWRPQRNAPAPDLSAALQHGFAALNAGDLEAARAALAVAPDQLEALIILGALLLRCHELAESQAVLATLEEETGGTRPAPGSWRNRRPCGYQTN